MAQINSNVKIWPEKEVDAGSVVNSSFIWEIKSLFFLQKGFIST